MTSLKNPHKFAEGDTVYDRRRGKRGVITTPPNKVAGSSSGTPTTPTSVTGNGTPSMATCSTPAPRSRPHDPRAPPHPGQARRRRDAHPHRTRSCDRDRPPSATGTDLSTPCADSSRTRWKHLWRQPDEHPRRTRHRRTRRLRAPLHPSCPVGRPPSSLREWRAARSLRSRTHARHSLPPFPVTARGGAPGGNHRRSEPRTGGTRSQGPLSTWAHLCMRHEA